MKAISTNKETGKTITQTWVGFEEALDEFKEILLIGKIRVFPIINELIESGESPFVIVKVDDSMTETTGEQFAFYELSDRMKVLLSTLRTDGGDSDIG